MSSSIGREHTQRILRHVVERLSPDALIADAIEPGDGGLAIEGVAKPIPLAGRLVVVAIGKASVPMATGAISKLGDRVSRALAVTKAGIPLTVDPPKRLEILEADHPVPTEASISAGRRVLEIADDLTADDLVLMLISGGGSALVEELVDGVSLEDLRRTTDLLLRAGATINELNAVRKRLSRIKGGRLARSIAPAGVVNLIISDVLGNPLQDIASGPTVRAPEEDATFSAVMSRSELIDGLPGPVLERLRGAQAVDEPWPDNVLGTRILADASTAARVAVEAASSLGYQVRTLGFDFQGEAREFGRFFATMARHVASGSMGIAGPIALVGSGELTVTVRGDGKGGRNTEMALAAAVDLEGTHGITVTSFATDGDDGTSRCAGGIVDGETIAHLRSTGADISQYLENNDSATALSSVDAAIEIGPTGTNVNDLYLALIQSDAESRG